MLMVCTTISSVIISGCEKEITSPNVLSQSFSAQITESSNDSSNSTDSISDTETQSQEEATEKEANESTQSETVNESNDVTEEFDHQSNAQDMKDQNKSLYAISEKTSTYIDDFGVQTIQKEYVVPFNADIKDIAPALLNINMVQYGIESIVMPQNFEEKKVVKSQIALTEEKAKQFEEEEIVYEGTDGTGILTLDPNSITVELNKNEKIPSSTSFKRTYDMAIKDQNQIPQTIKSNGITYYQNSVTWEDMGDSGTGINGTEGDSGYGTYNTVASSWRATVTYSGTKYTEDKDYKGTATYVGKILVNNSPTNTYVVTYKPNTMVVNSSGIYYNNYVNAIYNKENGKLSASGSTDMMGMYANGGYNNSITNKIITALLILLFVFVITLMYVALKVWKKVNDPDNIVATVNHEDVPVQIMEQEIPDKTKGEYR